jgi:hypothetical protein
VPTETGAGVFQVIEGVVVVCADDEPLPLPQPFNIEASEVNATEMVRISFMFGDAPEDAGALTPPANASVPGIRAVPESPCPHDDRAVWYFLQENANWQLCFLGMATLEPLCVPGQPKLSRLRNGCTNLLNRKRDLEGLL